MNKLRGILLILMLLTSIGTVSASPISDIIDSLKHLIPASIVGSAPPALQYPVYNQSDTVPCTGTYQVCPGGGCYIAPGTGTQCYRVASGNNIILKSIDPNNDASGVYGYCPNGAYDPFPNNNIVEAQCLGYCKPNTSVCDGDILKICNINGTDTINTRCTLGCEISPLTSKPACVLPHTPLSIELIPGISYLYGKDASLRAYVIVDDTPYQGALVTGKLLKDSSIISETSAYTQSDGYATLTFSNVEGIGTIHVIITTTYLDKTVTAEKDIYFGGETIVFTPTTYSYIQYTAKPIEFTVDIKDIKGKYITPAMGTLTLVATISSSNILDNSITYLGNGQYKILSNVSGSGIYAGKVKLSYYGVDFESKGIQIDVRDTAIEVNTAGIKPVAFLNTIENLSFTITSSIGGAIEPDNIIIDVQYPDGYTTKQLTMSNLKSLGGGIYEFNFTFNQLEKYTFNIYADKEGYTRGRSIISIAVASPEEEFNYIGFILSNAGIIAIVSVGASMFLLYRRRRNR